MGKELKMFRTVALVVIVIAPMHAAAAGSCMTKSEARRVYATAHLYWHGADHCWDATPGRRYTERRRHHFVRQHRDEDEVAQAEPQPVRQAEPQPVKQAQAQPAIQAQPQPVKQAQAQPAIQAQPQPVEEPAPLSPLTPPPLTSADLIRAGHTMRIEELESTLRDRWPDTHMEVRTAKPLLIESATADAQPTVSVGIVMLSIGGILVVCTILVAFGARVQQGRHGYM
jgi:hypothetical protein